jgi:hypothetical protein
MTMGHSMYFVFEQGTCIVDSDLQGSDDPYGFTPG